MYNEQISTAAAIADDPLLNRFRLCRNGFLDSDNCFSGNWKLCSILIIKNEA